MSKPLIQTTGRRKRAVARVGSSRHRCDHRQPARGRQLLPVGDPPHGAHRAAAGRPTRSRPTTSTPPSTAAAVGPGRSPAPRHRPAWSTSIPAAPRPEEGGLLTRDARKKESKKYGLRRPARPPVLEALTGRLSPWFGTDGLRGTANRRPASGGSPRRASAAAGVLVTSVEARFLLGRDTCLSGSRMLAGVLVAWIFASEARRGDRRRGDPDTGPRLPRLLPAACPPR